MKTLNSTLEAALNSPSVELFFAVELFFDQGTMRLWTGVGNKTLNGNVYTGTGSLLSITGMEEADDMSAPGASITLTGIDSAIVVTALSEPYQNRECRIHFGSGSDFVEVFSGFMDVMTIDDSGTTCTVNIQCESRLIMLDRIVPLRYTHETMQNLYPGDTFFSFVSDLADKQVSWGRSTGGLGGWLSSVVNLAANRGR